MLNGSVLQVSHAHPGHPPPPGAPAAVKFMVTQSLGTLNRSAHEAIISRGISHPSLIQTFFCGVALLEEEDFRWVDGWDGWLGGLGRCTVLA